MRKHRIIIDSHNQGPVVYTPEFVSLVTRMLKEGFLAYDILDRVNKLTLEKEAKCEFYEYRELWEKSRVNVVCASIGLFSSEDKKFRKVFDDINRFQIASQNGKYLKICKTVGDIFEAIKRKKRGVIFMIEDLSCITNSLPKLHQLYNAGIRIFQITYNNSNQLGCGYLSPQDNGLTPFGIEVIRELNNLGALVDFSHCSTKTTMEGVKIANNPICTHSLCYSISPHPRGKNDEILRELARAGGYFGVLLHPGILRVSSEEIFDIFIDNICHACEVMGINHVGIGTDWVGEMPKEVIDIFKTVEKEKPPGLRYIDWERKVLGYSNMSEWPNIVQKLEKRGFVKPEIERLVGLNFLDIFKKCGRYD